MPKISGLPNTTAPVGGDYTVMVETATGITKRVLFSDLASSLIPNMALANNPYKFRGYLNSAQSTSGGNWTKLLCDAETFDTNSNFDITTNKGRYTAPISGFYQLQGGGNIGSSSGTTQIGVAIYKNGSEISRGNFVGTTAGTSFQQAHVADLIQLTAGDYVELYVFCNGSVAMNVSSATSYFSGFLVSKT